MPAPQSRRRPLSSTRTSFFFRDRDTISCSTMPVQSNESSTCFEAEGSERQSYLRFVLRFVFFAAFFAFFAFFAMLSS
jgi:hypothetical protein